MPPPSVFDMRREPALFLEEAAHIGSVAIDFDTEQDAKSFYVRVRPLARGKCADLKCAIGRNGTVVWAATDPNALSGARLVKRPELIPAWTPRDAGDDDE